MFQQLSEFIVNIIPNIAEFGTWLTTPLYPPFVELSPLWLFSLGGISIFLTIHLVRLFIGG